MDTSSNNQSQPELSRGIAPSNIDNSPISGLEDIVKVHNNLDPGLPAQTPAPTIIDKYLEKVSKMFYLTSFEWLKTDTRGTVKLANYWVAPGHNFYTNGRIPYFVHELYKYAYYQGTFAIRLEFVGSSTFRGSLAIKRHFTTDLNASITSTLDARNTIVFSVDGGNKVVDWICRPGADANFKYAYPQTFFNTGGLPFLDYFIENISISVSSQLAAPSIYPAGATVVMYLIPLEVTFYVRRNNQFTALPTLKRKEKNKNDEMAEYEYPFIKHYKHFFT